MMFRRMMALAASLGIAASCTTTQTTAPKTDTALRSKVEASMVDAGREAEKRGDFPSAQAYYRSAYERDGKNVEAALGLSRMLRRLSRPREAMVIAERALEHAKENPRLMAELGKSQLAANDTLDAIESLSRAGSLLPDDWEIQSAIGVGYDRIGMYDQAAHRYEKALAIAPSNAVVLNNYALSLAQIGKLDQAIAMLEKATAMPERSPQMRQNLALLYAMNGRIEDAERLVNEDLSPELAAENIAYYRSLARNSNRGIPKMPEDVPSRAPAAGSDSGQRPAEGRELAAPAAPAAPVAPVARTDLAAPAAGAAPTPGRAEAPTATSARAPDSGPSVQERTPGAPTALRTAPTPASDVGGPAKAEAAAAGRRESLSSAPPPEAVKPAAPAPAEAATAEAEADDKPAARPAAPMTAAATETRPAPPRHGPRPAAVADDQVVAARMYQASERRAADAAAVPAAAKPAPETVTIAPAAPAAASSPPAASPAPRTAAKPERAAAVAASAAAKPEAATPGRVYRLQLGSYRHERDADHGVSLLRSAHQDIFAKIELDVVPVTLPESGDYYRILTGPFASQDDASGLCRELQSREVNCFVRRD